MFCVCTAGRNMSNIICNDKKLVGDRFITSESSESVELVEHSTEQTNMEFLLSNECSPSSRCSARKVK